MVGDWKIDSIESTVFLLKQKITHDQNSDYSLSSESICTQGESELQVEVITTHNGTSHAELFSTSTNLI